MKKTLQNARVEKDVENAYREELHKERPEASITSPHGTDGYAVWGSVRLLLEAKYNLDFKARVPMCNTLGQCLLYLKRFEQSGEPIPNVILVGDKDECFVLSTLAVKGFLDLPLDWSVAPSKGSPDLVRALVSGLNILPYVYDVDGKFKFRDVLTQIETLAEGEQHTVRATLTNIGAIFAYWKDRVFTGSSLTAVEQTDVFLRCLFQPTDVYLHPTKMGLLVVPGYPSGVLVSTEQYRSFFSHFVQGYKPSEIEAFYAEKDRLIEDDARRRQGAFFTPTLWVDEAHKMVSEVLGVNWKDECVVWDPAAGTGNLTRDYTFGDLIISTAEKPDVDVLVGQGRNPGAEVFQYDFLNPDSTSMFFGDGKQNDLSAEAVRRLKAAAKSGKRLVFLMNPPYGTANNDSTVEGDSKVGITSTSVNAAMRKAKLDEGCRQLYAQFMFQVAKLARDYGFAKVTVATFSVPTFMCSGSYKSFRDLWYKRFAYQKGMLFQASHFADVSGRWGISFTVWSEGTTDPIVPLPVMLKDVIDFAVTPTGVNSFYASDDREASTWVREPTRGLKGADAPQFSSGLKVKEEGRGKLALGSLFVLASGSNSIMKSSTGVFALSSAATVGANAGAFSVLPGESFRRTTALYAARKLVLNTWINHVDEYLAPNTTEGSLAYSQWNDDAIIYSLLDTKNNCTAMRNVPYKGGKWTIHNHFFWKTHAETLAALDTPATAALYRDAKAHPSKDVFGAATAATPDPYLASVLSTLNLSPEAQTVLDKLDALWVKSLPHREDYAAGRPELHLTAWDGGVYQLKSLWRELYPEDWKDLQEAFKLLADKLRPGVYTHGFLLR